MDECATSSMSHPRIAEFASADAIAVREASTAETDISGVLCDALGGVDTHRAAFTDLASNQLTTVSHIFRTLVSKRPIEPHKDFLLKPSQGGKIV